MFEAGIYMYIISQAQAGHRPFLINKELMRFVACCNSIIGQDQKSQKQSLVFKVWACYPTRYTSVYNIKFLFIVLQAVILLCYY